ncbi:fibronectin type III domain-containing protein [Propionispora hippei]|uniref:Fibronectin type III domain-containing protein n=1 Tax=Propionispora hippei DSM 15287 TaxID=1123003 RepID=A0A1M6H8H1_9FIRM|nr:fibronectin type III domain-containing protein [Propionispora hippei]SHJ18486.1 Fibronectin type III domain-containing protein [Propionispora hippei DSM 15287]
MATVGQSLKTPEAGWRRYDNTDNVFSYSGSNWIATQNGDVSAFYKGGWHYSENLTDKIIFSFYGAKLRIIAQPNSTRSNNLVVTIDGERVGTYSINSSTATHQCLDFEKLDLELKIHNVVISNEATNNKYILWDAVDIDATGYMLQVAPTNLTAIPGDSQVTLNWDAVTDVTSYNVKRSTTAGGPHETIATTIAGTSYVDTNVTNGTAYYYVVAAVNGDGEGVISNEASATPQATPVEEGQGLLRVTMIDSSEREYKLPMRDINGFIGWLNSHSNSDTLSYQLTTAFSSKEYLLFDKIISFEVIPLPAE